MARFRLRHVALHFAYLGRDYYGFAAQNAVDTSKSAVATVELALFSALQQSCLIESSETCGYQRCGRTDRGVSAAGQVVSLRLRSVARRSQVQPGEPGFDPFSSSALSPSTPASALQGSSAALGKDGDASDVPQPLSPRWARSAPAPAAVSSSDTAASPATPPLLHNGGEPFPSPPDELDYSALLNSLLPPDIRILGWADVGNDFSARFSCTSRVYRYYFPRRDLDLAG